MAAATKQTFVIVGAGLARSTTAEARRIAQAMEGARR